RAPARSPPRCRARSAVAGGCTSSSGSPRPGGGPADAAGTGAAPARASRARAASPTMTRASGSTSARSASPPDPQTLGVRTVEVWQAGLAQPATLVHELEATLSGDERDRGARLASSERWIVARAALRIVLAGHLEVHPSEIEFGA